jgi:hypothetical protein
VPVGLLATAVAGALAVHAGSSSAASYPIPPPVQGKRAVSKKVSGHVTVRRAGKKTFVDLATGASVPNGSEINATNGAVVLVVLQQGKRHTVSIAGGEFIFIQNPHTGRVVFKLALALTGCPAVPGASGERAGASAVRRRKPPKRHGPRRRKITVSDSGGNFGTLGQYAATSTEGTRWRTADSCGSSTVTVYRGRVRVTNLVTGRLITLTVGQHYTAHQHP